METKLGVSTYNCHHFKESKIPCINKLFEQSDFLLIQEHCLYESQQGKLCTIQSNICFVGTSAMNENVALRPCHTIAYERNV